MARSREERRAVAAAFLWTMKGAGDRANRRLAGELAVPVPPAEALEYLEAFRRDHPDIHAAWLPYDVDDEPSPADPPNVVPLRRSPA